MEAGAGRAYRDDMSNNNFAPIPPLVPNGDDDLVPGIIEDDDRTRVDPDADPEKVDDAEADRLASGADQES